MSPLKPIKRSICCTCGERTKGRQWWNRDTGYGLCSKCAKIIEKKESAEEMKIQFGGKGIHYCIEN